ncbi:hypothetical protein P280DRAFT_523416 [Massarina eburnea CBS 473.64]|uniref:Uncharacterized protein n=1 Tax=Massarina eburnea CBS 473.64 TaxID=1395130 RepID=A0A6A6RII9_9PLEO|nr:hypothetical protein P280DRAFT_523416 [Massarina eburnea CBS 473.64]
MPVITARGHHCLQAVIAGAVGLAPPMVALNVDRGYTNIKGTAHGRIGGAFRLGYQIQIQKVDMPLHTLGMSIQVGGIEKIPGRCCHDACFPHVSKGDIERGLLTADGAGERMTRASL